MNLTTHFTFDGQSEEALNFYCDALYGKIISLTRFSEMENGCSNSGELNPEDHKRILHGALQFGENTISCCDQMPGHPLSKGNNIMMDLAMSDQTTAKQTFEALANGGNIIMPLAPSDWTPLYGMLIDRYGIYWNIMLQ